MVRDSCYRPRLPLCLVPLLSPSIPHFLADGFVLIVGKLSKHLPSTFASDHVHVGVRMLAAAIQYVQVVDHITSTTSSTIVHERFGSRRSAWRCHSLGKEIGARREFVSILADGIAACIVLQLTELHGTRAHRISEVHVVLSSHHSLSQHINTSNPRSS